MHLPEEDVFERTVGHQTLTLRGSCVYGTIQMVPLYLRVCVACPSFLPFRARINKNKLYFFIVGVGTKPHKPGALTMSALYSWAEPFDDAESPGIDDEQLLGH